MKKIRNYSIVLSLWLIFQLSFQSENLFALAPVGEASTPDAALAAKKAADLAEQKTKDGEHALFAFPILVPSSLDTASLDERSKGELLSEMKRQSDRAMTVFNHKHFQSDPVGFTVNPVEFKSMKQIATHEFGGSVGQQTVTPKLNFAMHDKLSTDLSSALVTWEVLEAYSEASYKKRHPNEDVPMHPVKDATNGDEFPPGPDLNQRNLALDYQVSTHRDAVLSLALYAPNDLTALIEGLEGLIANKQYPEIDFNHVDHDGKVSKITYESMVMQQLESLKQIQALGLFLSGLNEMNLDLTNGVYSAVADALSSSLDGAKALTEAVNAYDAAALVSASA